MHIKNKDHTQSPHISAQWSVWPIADNICFDCKVKSGWPRPLLTNYEANKILLLLKQLEYHLTMERNTP